MMIQVTPTSKSWLGAEEVPEIQAVQIPLLFFRCSPETNECYEFVYYLQDAHTQLLHSLGTCKEGSLWQTLWHWNRRVHLW